MAGNTANRTPRIGVLALQGDFREHKEMLAGLGVDVSSVRTEHDLNLIDGLVIPGGESTVIDKLSRAFGVAEPIRRAMARGLPMFGTCAGLIMLADRVTGAVPGQVTFGGLDVTVRRNAFGSQTESFEAAIAVPQVGDSPMHAVFIRAPIVEQTGEHVEVIGALEDGSIVAVRQGNIIGAAFHPEVTADARMHAYFLDIVRRWIADGSVGG